MSEANGVQDEVEQFLFQEADLLDARKFQDWLGLFTQDALYWVPNMQEESDPTEDAIIVYEDFTGLRARVGKLLHPLNPTQMPPTRTRHLITNVMIREKQDNEVLVTSNQVVYVTQGPEKTYFPGSCEHVLVRQGGDWRILRKKFALISNDQPLTQIPVL